LEKEQFHFVWAKISLKKRLKKSKKVEIIIKIDNNFGEIEMCLNEELSFDIKIKSRDCDVYVLKKNVILS